MSTRVGAHLVYISCRHQDEVIFVSERDGNMELYSRRVENEMSSKKSYQRLTSDPSLQASIILCGPTLQLAALSGSEVITASHASRLCACPHLAIAPCNASPSSGLQVSIMSCSCRHTLLHLVLEWCDVIMLSLQASRKPLG